MKREIKYEVRALMNLGLSQTYARVILKKRYRLGNYPASHVNRKSFHVTIESPSHVEMLYRKQAESFRPSHIEHIPRRAIS